MKWKSTNLYASLEAWEKDYESLKETIKSISEYQGKLGDYDTFVKYYELQKELAVKFLKAYQYAALTFDLNRKITENGARVQQMAFLHAELQKATAFESPELLAIGKDKLDEFISKND